LGLVRHLSNLKFPIQSQGKWTTLSQDSSSYRVCWVEIGLCGIKAICGPHFALKVNVHHKSERALPVITANTPEPKTVNKSVGNLKHNWEKKLFAVCANNTLMQFKRKGEAQTCTYFDWLNKRKNKQMDG